MRQRTLTGELMATTMAREVDLAEVYVYLSQELGLPITRIIEALNRKDEDSCPPQTREQAQCRRGMSCELKDAHWSGAVKLIYNQYRHRLLLLEETHHHEITLDPVIEDMAVRAMYRCLTHPPRPKTTRY